MMATMNVSLSEPMKTWVETQARNGRYSNPSDSVRDLISRDQERVAMLTELQNLIAEGMGSGISEKAMEDVLAEARSAAANATRDR